jgi:broad specificity phosphatase PhoE
MTLEIYLVRHGESEINELYRNWTPKEKKVCGRNQWSELTEKGILQATLLGNSMEGMVFNGVYSSPAIRAQQTARYCMQAMGQKWPLYELDDRLSELGQGEWEGQLDCRVRPERVWEEIEACNWDFKPLNGESQRDVCERMCNFLDQRIIAGYLENCKAVRQFLPDYDQRDIIFTHKNAIACLLAPMMNLDKTKVHEMKIEHTSITILKYVDNIAGSSIKVNLTPHLEEPKND